MNRPIEALRRIKQRLGRMDIAAGLEELVLDAEDKAKEFAEFLRECAQIEADWRDYWEMEREEEHRRELEAAADAAVDEHIYDDRGFDYEDPLYW